MKKIKFRAISKMPVDEMDAKGIPHREGFVFGAYSDGYILGPVIEANEEFITHKWWVPVDKGTVEQCTLLKDMDGKEIYEGDIVNYGSTWWNDVTGPQSEGDVGAVKFDSSGATYIIDGNFADPLVMVTDHDIYAVVGNIHENPDLLEAPHD